MTAVEIQSNKIVSNEIKDDAALLEPSYGRNQTFLANPIIYNPYICQAWFSYDNGPSTVLKSSVSLFIHFNLK